MSTDVPSPDPQLPVLDSPDIIDHGFDVRWVDAEAHEGAVVHIGRDTMFRDPPGGRVVWNKAVHAPSAAYASCAEQVLLAIAERWGAPLVMVQDFQIQPELFLRNAVQLCRRLCRAGAVEQLILVDKPWMPTPVMKGVMATLRATGLRVYHLDASAGIGRYLDSLEPHTALLEAGQQRLLERRKRLVTSTEE